MTHPESLTSGLSAPIPTLFGEIELDEKVLRALAAADEASTSMHAFGPMNDKWLRGFAAALLDEGLTIGRASIGVLHAHGKDRVTHGRHCSCGACAREEWSSIGSPCGMHGESCPAVYDPLGSAGAIVPVTPHREASIRPDGDAEPPAGIPADGEEEADEAAGAATVAGEASTEDEPATGGWGWPGASRKAHYFNDSVYSLCGKWMYSGALTENQAGTSPDDCAACTRALAKLAPKEEAIGG